MNKTLLKLLFLFLGLAMPKAWAAGDPPGKARKVVAASEVLEQDALHALQKQLKGIAIQRTGTFTSSSAFHNQHRAYLESGPPIEYIFEAGKIPSPFPAGISSKEEFVRKQFLEMYKANPGYFLTNNSIEYWRTTSNIPALQVGQGEILLGFFDSVSENASFLNYIKVK